MSNSRVLPSTLGRDLRAIGAQAALVKHVLGFPLGDSRYRFGALRKLGPSALEDRARDALDAGRPDYACWVFEALWEGSGDLRVAWDSLWSALQGRPDPLILETIAYVTTTLLDPKDLIRAGIEPQSALLIARYLRSEGESSRYSRSTEEILADDFTAHAYAHMTPDEVAEAIEQSVTDGESPDDATCNILHTLCFGESEVSEASWERYWSLIEGFSDSTAEAFLRHLTGKLDSNAVTGSGGLVAITTSPRAAWLLASIYGAKATSASRSSSSTSFDAARQTALDVLERARVLAEGAGDETLIAQIGAEHERVMYLKHSPPTYTYSSSSSSRSSSSSSSSYSSYSSYSGGGGG